MLKLLSYLILHNIARIFKLQSFNCNVYRAGELSVETEISKIFYLKRTESQQNGKAHTICSFSLEVTAGRSKLSTIF